MASLEDLHKIGGFDELARIGVDNGHGHSLRAHPSLIMNIIEAPQTDDPTFDYMHARDEAMREVVGSARDDASREFDECVTIIEHIEQLLRIAIAQERTMSCARFVRAYTHTRKPTTRESLSECASALIACVNGLLLDEPVATITIKYHDYDPSPSTSQQQHGEDMRDTSVRARKVAIAREVMQEEARIMKERKYVQKIRRALLNARDQIGALVEMNKRTMIA